MKPKIINIAGYPITQISENEYEFENPEQDLDFCFLMDEPEEVTVIVFDSLIPPNNNKEASLGFFYVENLEEAVSEAVQVTKANVNEFVM